ncbi:MAG TPA: Holliday junction branch migration protein RuvA [Pseudomonadales bacterium]|jgi:Holliday junction DNA helicase RuvA|nr:Holliday junction branch migration protein RuvA [Cellvibrionales bacterium]HRF87886.1 Holliday junction branch migration protein RuvA [Pseudomonadales bacterium]HRG50739.1 Holliday junction branch migration protein RuvA [Pseudomonadales bacterium]
MIGSLRGTLLEKHPPLLLVDVQGVGYEVHAPMTTFYQLPALGSDIHLHTHFVVREDAQLLYGFIDKSTRELFRELIRINGLGPKMALAILSALDASELVLCIQNNQINTLTKVPGIGRKTAERLLVEMRDRISHHHSNNNTESLTNTRAAASTAAPSVREDAESALLALGYKPQEAEKMVQAILKSQTVDSSEELIRLALKQMLAR